MGSLNFMLVDGSQANGETFLNVMSELDPLSACSFETNPSIAVKKLCHENHRPDVILINIDISKPNVWELIEVLKLEGCVKGIPLLIYAADLKSRDVDRAITEGVICVFPGPKNYNELKTLLKLVVILFNKGQLDGQKLFLDWSVLK